MQDKYAIVVTTINAPTRAVKEIAVGARQLDAEFIVIGDDKSPPGFDLPDVRYLDVEAQRGTGLSFARLCPTRHYARKNVGYLLAAAGGATVIIETDDDNIPTPGFWSPRVRQQQGRVCREPDWVNVYAAFSDQQIWPRGLPLTAVRKPSPDFEGLPVATNDCPIQQGLADGDPDVDAIYRLVLPLPLNFEQRDPVILAGAWCPFNSQNTTFWKDAFPLLYLPFHCSFRMTDIWRSFVAQRLAYLNGWSIAFHNATVFQDRNEHNLLRDFEEEIPGYLHNDRIRHALDELDLPAGVDRLPDAVRRSYARLIELGLVGDQEAPLLDAFLEDLARTS